MLLATNNEMITSRKYLHNKYFIIFTFFATLVFILQNFLPISEFTSGLFIPDTVNMSLTLDYIHDGNVPIFSTGFSGIYYIYFFPWITHPSLSIIVNLIFVYYSFKLISNIFKNIRIKSNSIYYGLLLNPYLYLSITGPNKEIPLIFGTLFIVNNLINKGNNWLFKSLLASSLIIFIRDGYGVILIFLVFLVFLKINTKHIWKFGFTISIIAAIGIGLLFSNISIFSRNLLIAQNIGSETITSSGIVKDILFNFDNPIISIVSQILRMVYNWMTLAFFPIPLTPDGNLYILGISYWIFGIVIFISLLACLVVLLSNYKLEKYDKNIISLANFVVFLWCTTSVSLFIQPRYLMPILPLAFSVFALQKLKKRNLITILSIFIIFGVIIIYTIKGNPPPKLNNIESVSPSYIIPK